MTTEHQPPPPSFTTAGASSALLVTAVLGLLAAGVAGLVAGRAPLLGVLLGVALVCGFFLFGAVNTALAAAYLPRASLALAMLTYLMQVVALLLVLVAVERSGLTEETVDARWLSGTVIVGTVVWVAALVRRALREVRL